MKKWIAILLCIILLPMTALAHPGGLDAAQGHRDAGDLSGLGSYHYHCEGREAHLHIWSLCPFSEAYGEYKQAKDAILLLLEEEEMTEEKEKELRALLSHMLLPFGITKEQMENENVRFMATAEESVHVRKKPSAKGSSAACAKDAGTPVLATDAALDGWYPVQYWHQGVVLQGYVRADELAEISLKEYAALLCDLL